MAIFEESILAGASSAYRTTVPTSSCIRDYQWHLIRESV